MSIPHLLAFASVAIPLQLLHLPTVIKRTSHLQSARITSSNQLLRIPFLADRTMHFVPYVSKYAVASFIFRWLERLELRIFIMNLL